MLLKLMNWHFQKNIINDNTDDHTENKTLLNVIVYIDRLTRHCWCTTCAQAQINTFCMYPDWLKVAPYHFNDLFLIVMIIVILSKLTVL